MKKSIIIEWLVKNIEKMTKETETEDEYRDCCILIIFCGLVLCGVCVFLARYEQERERFLPWRKNDGTMGHGDVSSGIGYVCVASHGTAGIDTGVWLRADVDRHRSCFRHSRQLDILRKEA